MNRESIDGEKINFLIRNFESTLISQHGISQRTIKEWTNKWRKFQKQKLSGSKLTPIALNPSNLEKLRAAIAELSNNRLSVDALFDDSKLTPEEFERYFDQSKSGQSARPRREPEDVHNDADQGATDDHHDFGFTDQPETRHSVRLPESRQPSDRLISQYCDNWRKLFTNANLPPAKRPPATRATPLDPVLEARIRRLDILRLDCYVWPGLCWQQPADKVSRQEGRRTAIPGEGEPPARSMLATLIDKRLVVLHDDAGMGKTAFTYKCFELLISPQSVRDWFHGRPPLVVRLEGRWPRSTGTGPDHAGETHPMGVRDMLVAELLRELQRGKSPTNGDEDAVTQAAAEDEVDAALAERRVVVFLDGFDQMTRADREFATSRIASGLNTDEPSRDEASCVWFLTGRAYAIREFESRLPRETPRLRLERFSESQQDFYFRDLAKAPFFRDNSVKPLDWICQPRQAVANELGLPLHLREIRLLLEQGLSVGGDAAADLAKTGATEPNVSRIATTGQLHEQVSTILLERAIRHHEDRRKSEEKQAGRLTSLTPLPGEPQRFDEKLRELRAVCGVLAFQMMLEENWNASVDASTSRDEDPPGVSTVDAFCERARQRFLASRSANDSTTYRDNAQAMEAAVERWNWAATLLEEIEVTHRGDIDAFNGECRSFRDRKAMEWYAAHYLMNHATPIDLRATVSGAGDCGAIDFVGDREWGSNCWRQVIEMPLGAYRPATALQTLSLLFERPRHQQCRPYELMWQAWETWLEPESDPEGSARKPLRGSSDVITKFRQEFSGLCDAGNPVALALRFDFDRDRPDGKLKNKTPHREYRRIPPTGSSSSFRGERPDRVQISPFWLRKFVVTNAEFGLFDPSHKSGFPEANRPVEHVNWYGAAMFCRWLGPEYRLPTGAQWEAASRANENPTAKETPFWFGVREQDLARHAWFTDNSNSCTHTLRESLDARDHENPWGLYDMHGNVWEWCADWYGAYDSGQILDPPGAIQGSSRVSRGGGWRNSAGNCRSAYRDWHSPDHRSSDLGFRVALVRDAELESAEREEASEAGSAGPVAKGRQPRERRGPKPRRAGT